MNHYDVIKCFRYLVPWSDHFYNFNLKSYQASYLNPCFPCLEPYTGEIFPQKITENLIEGVKISTDKPCFCQCFTPSYSCTEWLRRLCHNSSSVSVGTPGGLQVVSISAFFSILCRFIHKGAYFHYNIQVVSPPLLCAITS